MAYKTLQAFEKEFPKGQLMTNGSTKRHFSAYELYLEQLYNGSLWKAVATKKAEEPTKPQAKQADLDLNDKPTDDGKEDTAAKKA